MNERENERNFGLSKSLSMLIPVDKVAQLDGSERAKHKLKKRGEEFGFEPSVMTAHAAKD